MEDNEKQIVFMDYSITFLRTLTTILMYKNFRVDSTIFQDYEKIRNYKESVELFERTNEERYKILEYMRQFILLNQTQITDRYHENNWNSVTCDNPLHEALRNVLQSLSPMEKDVINIQVLNLAYSLGLQLLPVMNSVGI